MHVVFSLVFSAFTNYVIWLLTGLPTDWYFILPAFLILGFVYDSLFFAPGLAYDAPTKWSILAFKWVVWLSFLAAVIVDYRVLVHSGVKWLLVALVIEAVLSPVVYLLGYGASKATYAAVAAMTGFEKGSEL
jgi:hypothetical protein